MIAVIPIRSGSKGIPDKNIKALNGKPLIWWTLNALEQSQVDRVIVATDAPYIELLERFPFSKLEIYHRDPKNAQDTSSTEAVLLEVIQALDIDDDVMLVQATSPLTSAEDFNKGIALYADYDSILSVVEQKRFIWNANGTPSNYDYKQRPRRQEFDGYFVENGAFYINHSGNILQDENRLSGRIGLCEMPERTYFEIDSLDDWTVIESILKNS